VTRAIIAMALCLVAMMGLMARGASAATWRFVAPGGSDAGNNCEDQWARCATIQHAIDEASAGDSVNVAPGIYAEHLTIDKPLTLRSQDGVPTYWYQPETRIDGGVGTAIRVEGNAVQISGFEVSTVGAAPAILVSGANVDDLRVEENVISGGSAGVYLEAGGKKDMIGYNVIEGTGDGIHLSGAAYSNLAIKWNRFAAPIDEYAVLADNSTTIEGFRLEGNKMPAPARIARLLEEPGEENGIYENTFESTQGPQLAINGLKARVMDNRFEGHGTVGCLQILGSTGGLTPSSHILVSRENEFVQCDPYGIELGPAVDSVSIFGNVFSGTYDGVVASGSSPWNVTGRVRIEGNRIVGTTHLGVVNQASGTLGARENWWGCNAGPGGSGCDAVSPGVDSSDNVRLEARIGPRSDEFDGIIELPTGNSIELDPGEEADVAAVLTSNGSGINLGIPTQGVPVSFSSSVGTLHSATSSFHNGWTMNFFTAGPTPGPGSIVVSMDNQQTLVPVTIRGATASTLTMPIKTPRAPILAVTNRDRLTGRRATVGLVSCADPCQVAPGKAQIVIGHHSYRGTVTPRGTLAAGSTTPIRVALPRPALRALRRLGSARIRVMLTVTDSNSQTTKRAILATVNA
jgi:Periplasmic copper-binding protein (NosD)